MGAATAFMKRKENTTTHIDDHFDTGLVTLTVVDKLHTAESGVLDLGKFDEATFRLTDLCQQFLPLFVVAELNRSLDDTRRVMLKSDLIDLPPYQGHQLFH